MRARTKALTNPHSVAVACIEPAAEDQFILAMEHHAVLEAAHTRPGQYCKLSLGPSPNDGHFVLIDPPGAGPFRFLLRAGGPAADELLRSSVGAAVTIDGPLGDGFPLERARGRDVLLVSAGTGIAAVRPVLLGIVPFTARHVWLYHGTRTHAHVPFLTDLKRAQEHGVSVTVCVSRETAAKSIEGRVQQAIDRDKPDLSNAVAFVSGMNDMVDALRLILPRLGLAPENIFLNY